MQITVAWWNSQPGFRDFNCRWTAVNIQPTIYINMYKTFANWYFSFSLWMQTSCFNYAQIWRWKSELHDCPSCEQWEKKTLPFKIKGCAETRLGGIDPGIVLGQHAAVPRPALHVNLLLAHHAQLVLWRKIIVHFFFLKFLPDNLEISNINHICMYYKQ